MQCSGVLAFTCLYRENPSPMRTLLFSLTVLLASIPTAALASTPDAFANLDTKATQYLASKGILEGSLDGSMHLASNITRANFVQAVVDYVYPQSALSEKCLESLDTDAWPGLSYSLLFSDVSTDAPYALHLCAAMRGGLIWGYTDGSFKPYDTINLAEASKVLSIAFNLGYTMPMYNTDDWYVNYLRTVRRYTVFPETISSPSDALTVKEARTLLQNVSARLAAHHGSDVMIE